VNKKQFMVEIKIHMENITEKGKFILYGRLTGTFSAKPFKEKVDCIEIIILLLSF